MISAFAKQLAAMLFEMTDECATLRRDLQRLADNVCARRISHELSIRREHHLHGLAQIATRLVERRSLRIGAGQLFDEAEAAFGHTAKNGG